MILGNDIDPNTHIKIQGLRSDKHDDNSSRDSYLKHITAPVTTRSQTAKTKEKDKSTIKNSEEKTTSKTNSINMDDNNRSKSNSNSQEKSHIFGRFSKEAFKQTQERDKSLSKLKFLASAGMSGYAYEDGLMIRRFENKIDNQISIIVPSCLRMEVFKLAHEIVFAGHLGIASTKKSLLNRFTWPGVTKDIANYVKSREICQKHAKKKPKIPLGKMEVIKKPFEKVVIDIVGPLPETNKGNSYILTLVDFSTRWPEAIPLKRTKTENVAEALFDIFSRLGIPKVVLSDNGRQLILDSMQETMKMLGVEQKLSAPLHPQSHGLVERCNQTIQKTLVKLSEENPLDWDILLNPTLFALRQMPHQVFLLLN